MEHGVGPRAAYLRTWSGPWSRFAVATVVLCVAYGWLARHVLWKVGRDNLVWRAALGVGVFLHVAWAATIPRLSTDFFTYIVFAVTDGASPREATESPLILELVGEYGYRPGSSGPSVYGPVWMAIAKALGWPVSLEDTHALGAVMVAFKVVALATTLGCSAMTYLAMWGHSAAVRRSTTLVVLLNPVLTIELAGEGHNEATMLFLAMLGLVLVRRGALYASAIASLASVLVKYVSVLVMVPFGGLALRRAHQGTRLALAIPVVVFVGYMTLGWFGLVKGGWMEFLVQQARSALYLWPIGQNWVGLRYLAGVLISARAGWWVTLVIRLTFVVAAVACAVAPRRRQEATLAAAILATTFLFCLDDNYWPWHVCLPLVLWAPLVWRSRDAWVLVLTLTFTARLVSVTNLVRQGGGLLAPKQERIATSLVAVVLPSLVALVLLSRAGARWSSARRARPKA